MSATQTLSTEPRAAPATLSQPTILRFFAPLALSWIFMSVEGPVSVALISRLPNAEVSTAAFQIMLALAMWIESPIIDLLSTSTTLAKNRQNFAQISKFTWWLIAWVTFAHAILVFTPVYGLVAIRLMGVPEAVAAQARIGLAVMIPWSGSIGWRRYLQGILIRNSRTKAVGYGTAIRVGTMVVMAVALYETTSLPSIQIAGLSLISAVFAEALFIHIASRGTVRERFREEGEGEPVSMRKLARFHFPLSATSMVVMLAMPITSWALSHSAGSVGQLAGYQVASTLVWLMRTTTYSLPEVVITLYKDVNSARALRIFCTRLGLGASAVMLALWLTCADRLFFTYVLRADPGVVAVAHVAFIFPLLIPLINALQSYVRGMLTAHHLTVSRLMAIGASVLVLLASLSIGLVLHIAGVVSAGISMTIAAIAELVVLAAFLRKLGPRSEVA